VSFRGEHRRGRRDAHLIDVIVRMLAGRGSVETTIVKAAGVFGRHACRLAARLPGPRHLRRISTRAGIGSTGCGGAHFELPPAATSCPAMRPADAGHGLAPDAEDGLR
jgi:hypothetical protein